MLKASYNSYTSKSIFNFQVLPYLRVLENPACLKIRLAVRKFKHAVHKGDNVGIANCEYK